MATATVPLALDTQYGENESQVKIEPYQENHKDMWDGFVRKSKNGTFLFLRDYMGYHRERFEDHSLLIREDDGTLVALLPANRNRDRLESHGGLTYGGFITNTSMKVPKMLETFESTFSYLMENNFTTVLYKTIPHIYHRFPAEEDRYALFLCGAKMVRRGVLAVVDPRSRLDFQERRLRGIKKAIKNDLYIKDSCDFDRFWPILTEVLWETYKARPVHRLDEMVALHSRFPENIRLYLCYQGEQILAGTVMYKSERVVRAQYIATTALGKKLGALDLLFKTLLDVIYSHDRFFDFGTSDEENGYRLNKGLIDQKEGFGARAVMHDHYEIDLSQYVAGQWLKVMS